MWQCYMIYEAEEGKRNRHFIKMFQHAGEKYGMRFSYVSEQGYQKMPLPQMVLNRTRNPDVSLWYERQGILVLHSAELVRLGNDKWQALQYLEGNLPEEILRQKWCAGSFLGDPAWEMSRWAREILERFGTISHVVLKTRHGHGGQEVFRLAADPRKEPEAWEQVMTVLQEQENILCQEWIDSGSRDIRAYLLGGEIYAAVLRQGQKDFRSNYSLGGQVKQYLLTDAQKNYIMKFADAFPETLWLAGLDFLLVGEGGLVFNELEEMVGSRMLYQCSEKDIVADAVRLLAQKIDAFIL